jgi:hypothetical protein
MIKSRNMGWEGRVTRTGAKKSVYRDLWGNLAERENLEERKRGWEDNIKIDIQEAGWVGMDCIYMTQDRESWRAFLDAVLSLRVP